MKSFSNFGKGEEEGHRGCAERALCEASAECMAELPGTSSIFCQFGTYATSWALQMQSGVGFEALYEAGRRGRSGEDCRTHFMDCNAVWENLAILHFNREYPARKMWKCDNEKERERHGKKTNKYIDRGLVDVLRLVMNEFSMLMWQKKEKYL